MKPLPECVPDALDKILTTARAVSDDPFIHSKVLLKVMGELADDGAFGNNPADIYLRCWEIACRALGVRDPYENEKARSDKAALGVLKSIVESDFQERGDALRRAVRISLTGAMLDYRGLGRDDMQENALACLERAPAADDTDALCAAIEKADSVMLVAHRAGEVALDKPLAEAILAMGKRIYLVVSSKPVFLMATEKDAANADYPDGVETLTPGPAMYGLAQERASSEFRDLLSGVGLVIVKGGTHFATMAPQRDLFFILKAQEREVAEKLRLPVDSGAIVRMPAG